MKSAWLLGLTLIAATLNANSARAEIESFAHFDGNAMAICQGMTFSSDKMSCFNAIQGKRYSQMALQVCSTLTFDSEKTNCLIVTANKNFSPSAAQVCKGMTFGSERVNCLNEIAEKSFDRDLVTACAKLTFDSEKLGCMKENVGGYFVPNATQLCSSLTFNSDTRSCLRTVANRFYSPGETSFCGSMTFASETISCLARTGIPHGGIRPSVVVVPAPVDPIVATPCGALVREVTQACRGSLSARASAFLKDNADYCEQGESKTGKTTVTAFAGRNSTNLLVINKEGQDRCVLKSASMPSPVAYITAVRGSSRSDKLFVRLSAGQLVVMDMGHQLNEVLNANRRSYNLSRIEASGMERLELTHRGNTQKSELTFDRLDTMKSEGRLNPMTSPQAILNAVLFR